eukprot:scaffold77820_cov12-Tisochrysis_lutea.AAC.1
MSVKAHEFRGPGKTSRPHGRQHTRVLKAPALAVEMSVKAHENWGPGKTGKLHGRQHARVSKTPAFAVEML